MKLSRKQAKRIRKLGSRKHREETGAFLVEGVRLVEELLDSDCGVELVVTAPTLADTERGARLRDRIGVDSWKHAHTGDSELSRLSDTETPQGVLAVAKRGITRLADLTPDSRVLVFDGVSDPGNLGTLLRTADALGIDRIVALPGTVDPWNPKAVRASAGSLFRVPVSCATWDETRDWLRAVELPILCADPAGEPVERGATGGFALVLGSEASGLSEPVAADCDRCIAVALRRGVDSLNVAVAGALLLDRLLSSHSTGRADDA